MQLLALLHNPCRVFLTHLQQRCHKFFGLAFVHSLNGARIFRVRIFDEIEFLVNILAVKCIASLNIFQLHGTSYVAGIKLLHRNTVGSRASINLSDALLAASVGIRKVVARLYASAHNLEVRNLSDMRLHTGLEEINRLRSCRVGSDLLTTRIMHLRHLAHERHHITQEFHQTAHSHILTCANAEYGEDRTRYESLADALTQFVLCERLLFKELLHKRLVILGSSLYERLVHLHRLVHLLCRNVLDDRRAPLGLP